MKVRGGSFVRVVLLAALTVLVAPAHAAENPIVLLISIDAFRWDYPEIHPCPEINKLIARGVRAEGLISVYPTYTFPNHYAIVTGLRPETNGIISNDMYDPVWKAWFHTGSNPAAREGRWWGGEPIWLTATRQGRTSASYFERAASNTVLGKAMHIQDADMVASLRRFDSVRYPLHRAHGVVEEDRRR